MPRTRFNALGMAVLIGIGSVLTVSPQTGLAQSLERRVDRLEDRVSGSAMMRMMNQNETLQREITTLRGEIERLQRQIDDIRDQQRQLYLDLDGRLQALERADSESGTDGGDSDDGSGGDDTEMASDAELAGDDDLPVESSDEAANDAAEADSTAAREAYQSAFSELQAGRYDAAVEAFRQFLDDHPDAELAANARYWLGESHYVVRDFDAAMTAFKKVVNDHADSRKHPDALLKIGYVHLEQDRDEQGRETLQQVIEAFPDSTAARLARTRLEES